MLCATLPLIPAPSNSEREARKMAWGVRNCQAMLCFPCAESWDHSEGQPVEFFVVVRLEREHGFLW